MMSDTDEDCGLVSDSELLSITKPRSNHGKTSKRKAPPISSSDSEEDRDRSTLFLMRRNNTVGNIFNFIRIKFIFIDWFVFSIFNGFFFINFTQFPLNDKGGNKWIITN